MFKRKLIPDYQAELPWKYPDRPVLKSWHRWAIPYNLLHIQIAYAVATLVSFGIGFVNYKGSLIDNKGWFQLDPIMSSIVMFSLFMGLFYVLFFEKKNYVYRCTAEGVEVCSWKEGYKKAISFIKVAAVLGMIALIFTAVHTNQPSIFLLAFAGPGGIALVYATSMGKNLQQFADENHKELAWHKVHTVLTDNSRKIITLLRTHHAKDKHGSYTGVSTTYAFYVVCPINSFEDILLFIKQQLPNAEYRKEKATMKEMYKRIDSKNL